MNLLISIDGDDQGSLGSLQRWLAADPELRRSCTFELVPSHPRPGEMGPVFDVINAVISDGTGLGSLLIAYMAWRDSRPHAPAVRIERDGVVVNLAEGSPEVVDEVLAALGESHGS
jgi:hypothetical protein